MWAHKFKMAHQHSHHGYECDDHGEDGSKWLEIERLYQEKSTENETMIKWLQQNVKDYLNTNISDDKFTVVSFGCGDGTKDIAALQAILDNLNPNMKVFYRGVDPDEKALGRFKEAVNQSESLRKVNMDFLCQTYEGYVERKFRETSPGKANLILFIDSFCHLTQHSKDVLLHCFEHELSPNGAIVILLWNADDFWFKIRKKFLKPTDIEGSNANAPKVESESNDYRTVQELMQITKEFNMKYEMHAPRYSLDVSDCFESDSKEGILMMELLKAFSNLQGTEADISRDKLLEFLQHEAEVKGSSRVLNGNHGILIVHK